MKRLLCLLLALLFLLSTVACTAEASPTQETEETTTTPETSDDAPKDPPSDSSDDEKLPTPDEPIGPLIYLAREGVPQYKIVSTDADYDIAMYQLSAMLTQKTGVSFACFTSASKPGSGKKIQLGTDPAKFLKDPASLAYCGILSYDTGLAIHLTSYASESVLRAIQKFSEIDFAAYTKIEADGTRTVAVPSSVLCFMDNTGSYPDSSPTLMGRDLSDYRIVFPANPTMTEQLLIKDLVERLGRTTGHYVASVSDKKSAHPYEIVLGKTNRAESTELYRTLPDSSYRIFRDGEKIFVAYDNYLVLYHVIEQLFKICLDDSTEHLDVCATPDTSALMIPRGENVDLRIMSSNAMVSGDMTCQSDYELKYGVDYADRMQIIGDMIMEYLPDFVGLQEMQEGTINGVNAWMRTELLKITESKYAYAAYEQSDHSNNITQLLYRKDVWELDATGIGYVDWIRMHRWNWALFHRIDNPDDRCIILNVHSNGGSASTTIAELYQSLLTQYPGVPIFLIGDLNAQVGTWPYTTLTNNSTLATASSLTDNLGTYSENTQSLGVFRTPIDHILVPTDLADVEGYRFIDHGLMYMTSGHRPIVADISLKSNNKN